MSDELAKEFSERVRALVDELGFEERVMFRPELLARGRLVPQLDAGPVLAGQLELGGRYRLLIDGRETQQRVSLSPWLRGLQDMKQLEQALAELERVLRPLATLAALDSEVSALPARLAQLYSVRMDPLNEQLSFEPRARQPPPRTVRSRGGAQITTKVEVTNSGGRRVSLAMPDGSPARFGSASWVVLSLGEAIAQALGAHHAGTQLDTLLAEARERALAADYELDMPRKLLRVSAEGTSEPIYFALSVDPRKPGLLSVCSELAVLDFDPRSVGRPYTLRKPVVYFWPTQATELEVEIRAPGPFVSQYPKQNAGEGRWRLLADPDGMLRTNEGGRSYAYLFWEALGWDFSIDLGQAYCVRADEAADFLERVAAAHAFEVRERTDFVSYWLPALERNAYSLVQLLEPEDYARLVPMRVEPQPDTLIRLMMIFRSVQTSIEVGAPELPRHRRAGFCVVEWGGVNLDELASSPALRR